MSLISIISQMSSGNSAEIIPPTVQTFQVQSIGDSLCAGFNATDRPTQSYSAKLFAKLELMFPTIFSGYQFYGQGGADINTIRTVKLAEAIAEKDETKDFNIILIQGGINNLGSGGSVIDLQNGIINIHQEAIAAGYITIAMTISAENNDSLASPPATVETKRLEVNQFIRDNLTGSIGASGLIDVGADAGFSPWNVAGQNATYIDAADQLHYTDEGHRYIGEDLAYPVVIEVAV